MDDFYAARDITTTPLPWPSIAPPITFVEAVTSYATETSGYTRSKVCFSDNWFREQRWLGHVEEARSAQVEKIAREATYLEQLAASVKARDWMCAHISIALARKLLLRELVSEDELRLAGVAY